MIELPLLTDNLLPQQMDTLTRRFDLQARGANGEHSLHGPNGRWDISNRQRIGFTEVELVQKMIDGVEKLINIEILLEGGVDIRTALGENADILGDDNNDNGGASEHDSNQDDDDDNDNNHGGGHGRNGGHGGDGDEDGDGGNDNEPKNDEDQEGNSCR